MIKVAGIALLFVTALSGSAFAAQNAVSTPFTNCNEAQLKQAQNAVDSIPDPQKKSAASQELSMAVQMLQSNDPQGCLEHLTNASKYVTP
jgi:hypothetical protein